MLELEYEFLCEVIANLDTAQIIGAGPYGVRRIVPKKKRGGILRVAL